MPPEKRPITADDLNNIHYVQDPQFSPNGQYIAFVKVTPDPIEKGYKRNIWLHDTQNKKSIQLTRGNKDSYPRWSPDGTAIAFVSSRNDKPQIYILPTAGLGGEARTLTKNETGATNPAWSPDGTQIAYLTPMTAEERQRENDGEEPEAPPIDQLEGKHRKERKQEDEKNRWEPRAMWRIPYRRGTSFVDERYQQVCIIPTNESLDAEAAKHTRLTDMNADFDPPKWSADGTKLYTSRTFKPLSDEPWRSNSLYVIDVATSDSDRLLEDEYNIYLPSLSPDGKWIAYIRRVVDVTDIPMRLVVMSIDGTDIRVINEDYNREAFHWAWSPNNQLAFVLGSEGTANPYLYDPETDTSKQLHSGIYDIEQLAINTDNTLAMTVSTPQNPQELYILKGGDLVEVTTFNQEWLDKVIVQDVHELRFESPHGEVQGWYLKPVGYEDGQKYPLALNIHGGPHATWGYSTKTMWHEWQFHAARGYAVFYCNPHGSGGYGQAFMRKLHAAWGPVAMDDIMAGVDKFLELGIADENRMTITGGSYGGYMTAWIIGHTDRFKSAVSQRGVYNINSFYGTSDIPVLMSNEFDAEPWENHDVFWKNSPLKYASNIKTPLLLIHSEYDYRVPIEQAEQLFAWVRRSTDTPIHMIRYPREGHELSRSGEPLHRISRLTEMVDWFDKYVDT